MNAEIETQIRNCEARLYAAMLASDVAELDALLAAYWSIARRFLARG